MIIHYKTDDSSMLIFSWRLEKILKYTAEMKSAKSLKAIRNLAERSRNGEIIRLLCYEKDGNPFCHR